jgi:hypothetical protein
MNAVLTIVNIRCFISATIHVGENDFIQEYI